MTGVIAGRYQIVAPLGGGGTSLVYRARYLAGGDEVALKVLRPQFAADASLRRRFSREAELVRGLDHPCIVRVLDAGEHDGAPFLTMELVRAETLRQRLDRERRIPLAAARVDTFVSGLRGREPRVSVESVKMSTHLMFFDASKAVRELGLPQTPVAEALERAVRWFRGNGYVAAA